MPQPNDHPNGTRPKSRKLVFVNPTARLKVNQPEPTAPQPVDVELLRAHLNSDDPVKAALVRSRRS